MSIYLRYVLRADEPIRIADDSSSQHGQTTSLRYIPGSTIRGMVINRLAGKPDVFDEVKKTLFSDKTAFLNAYPSVSGKELIPSPKGFYEDKTIVKGEKTIKNVVINGEVYEGWKRAGLGEYSELGEGKISFYSVNTISDMRITRNSEKKDVFRHEMIEAGEVFIGYILCHDEMIATLIKDTFGNQVYIGNAKASGIGRCVVEEITEVTDDPYSRYMPKQALEGECYLYLISDMTMRSPEGEYIGIDTSVLADILGVSNLTVKYASSSIRDVRGYNRNWGGRIPSVAMYEKGSVFNLCFSGAISPEKAKEVIRSGIGVRRNEGFGRILILDRRYESIKSKELIDKSLLSKTRIRNRKETPDDPTLRIVATSYLHNLVDRQMESYIPNVDSKALNQIKSQRGKVDEICTTYRYEPDKAFETLYRFFGHAMEKEQRQNIQKQKRSKVAFRDYVFEILETDLWELLQIDNKSIMGFLPDELETEDWKKQSKVSLISKIIRYENKKEV